MSKFVSYLDKRRIFFDFLRQNIFRNGSFFLVLVAD